MSTPCIDCGRPSSKKWKRRGNPLRCDRCETRYRKSPDHFLKKNSQALLGRAIKTGELVRGPCESCGTSSAKIEGHHDDYSKPLVVRWLCAKCHTRHHHDVMSLRREIATARLELRESAR